MRKGLRIRGRRGNPAVRSAVLRFAKWLRLHYDFPMRVPVYLLPGEHFTTIEGKKSVASFFYPHDRTEEPYIRLATGDYNKLRKQYGRDDALAMTLESMARQVIRYQDWVFKGKLNDKTRGERAKRIMNAYSKAVDRP